VVTPDPARKGTPLLPEVEHYENTVDTAYTDYRETINARRAEYDAAGRGSLAGKIFSIHVNAASEIRTAKTDAAWDTLRASEDRALAWIARNCAEWKPEALLAMKALPITTLAQIQVIAEENSWCEENWGPFRDKAISEGLITDGPVHRTRRALRDWFVNNHSDYSEEIAALFTHVDAIVAAALVADREITPVSEDPNDGADEEAEEQATEPTATADHGTVEVELPPVSANFAL
jgi:hypothetical protein